MPSRSDDPTKSHITRRAALIALAGSASGLLARGEATAEPSPETGALLPGANVCLITPEATEGPFYFDPELERREIADGRPGVPLKLLLQVVDGATCAPISGARVDVWHSDAGGQYSGYRGQGDEGRVSTVGQSFLRGTQRSDGAGHVHFATIYPGWYPGRTPHIHFKVFPDEASVLTGQMYFPDAISESIYTSVVAYRERKAARDTFNATDFLLRSTDPDHASVCAIKEEGTGYLASLIIGVDRTGEGGERIGPRGRGERRFAPRGQVQDLIDPGKRQD